MSNSNWPRWIFSSVTQYFQAVANAYPIELHVEGIERDTTDKKTFIELRIDGPTTKELSHNYNKLSVTVEILWSVDMTSTDFHESWRLKGAVLDAFDDMCITETDGTHLGTLILKSETRVADYGQIKEDVQIVQGTVAANFEMFLEE